MTTVSVAPSDSAPVGPYADVVFRPSPNAPVTLSNEMLIEKWTGRAFTPAFWIAHQLVAGLCVGGCVAFLALISLGRARLSVGLFCFVLTFEAFIVMPRASVDWRRIVLSRGFVFDAVVACAITTLSFLMFERDAAFTWASYSLLLIHFSVLDVLVPQVLRFDDWKAHMLITAAFPLGALFMRFGYDIHLFGAPTTRLTMFTVNGETYTVFSLVGSLLDVSLVRVFQSSWGNITPGLTHGRARLLAVQD